MPPTVNNVWANTAPSSVGEQITLPSGQTCLARRLDIEHLVSAGVLEQADSLTSLVDAKHVRKVRGGKGPDKTVLTPNSIMRDTDALKSILTVADRAVPLIVLDPVVKLHYTVDADTKQQRMLPADEREEGVVYTDQIGLADKMELFAWAMGDIGGLQSFRDITAGSNVGTVADGADVPRKAKRTPRAKG